MNPDGGLRNCPKHVDFHLQNGFEKLVHLVDYYKESYIYNFVFYNSTAL
jgi:hypothetical protein